MRSAGGPRANGERGVQAVVAPLVSAGGLRLGRAVGDEHERVAGVQRGVAVGEARAGDDAQKWAAGAEAPDRAVGTDQARRRVTGGDGADASGRAVSRRVDERPGERDELVRLGRVGDQSVEPRRGGAQVGVRSREVGAHEPEAGLDGRGEQRRAQALAHHVRHGGEPALGLAAVDPGQLVGVA